MRDATSRYARPLVAIHWLTLLFIAFNYLFSDAMSHAYRAIERGRSADITTAVQMHAYVGIGVLVLVALRVFLRVILGAPAAAESGNALMDMAAKAMHLALYALLFIVPLTGMATWYAGLKLGGLHQLSVNLIIFLAFAHAAAGLYHHYMLKDGLLRRMT